MVADLDENRETMRIGVKYHRACRHSDALLDGRLPPRTPHGSKPTRSTCGQMMDA